MTVFKENVVDHTCPLQWELEMFLRCCLYCSRSVNPDSRSHVCSNWKDRRNRRPKYNSGPNMVELREAGNLCSSCAFIAGLTDTQRTDNGLMEARCVLRGRGHGDPVRPRVQTQGRAAGTCAQRNVANPGIPTGSRLPSECATSTRSGACPIRRRGRPSSHPRGHERAGRTRAESPQRTASRAGAGAGAWQGSGSGRHASGRYQAAAPSLVLEPWRHRRNIPKCLFVLRSAPVVLSALGGSCRVRRSFTVHDDWSSQVCFHQAMAITSLFSGRD